MKESPPTAREYLATLAVECIGKDRILSRALYRLAYDTTQQESVGAVFRPADRFGREVTLEHLLLLPEKACRWVVEGFLQLVNDQGKNDRDEFEQMVVFVGTDLTTGGIGWQTLASKSWATDFFCEAMRRRPVTNS